MFFSIACQIKKGKKLPFYDFYFKKNFCIFASHCCSKSQSEYYLYSLLIKYHRPVSVEWWELHWLCHHRIPSNILSTFLCPPFTAVLKSHLSITFKRNNERASLPMPNHPIVSFVHSTAVDFFASSLCLVNYLGENFSCANLDEESFLMINEVPCM